MTPNITVYSIDEPPGLVVHDQDTGRRVRIETDERPSIRELAPEQGDRSVEISCSHLQLPEIPVGHVRDDTGRLVHTVTPTVNYELRAKTYVIELHASMKLYLTVSGPGRVTTRGDRLSIELASGLPVAIAVRSYHDTPHDTITTTEDPADLLDAISTFGSALKTTTPERSYPTLRGHPPQLRLGDELSIPNTLELPTNEVILEFPPTLSNIFAAAPLAYYLSATCVSSTTSCLRTPDGVVHEIVGDFITGAEQLLKQVFVLDAVVRTAGIYDVPLAEQDAFQRKFEWDLNAVYRSSLSEQLQIYLSIPYDDIADLVPQWGLTADVPSNPTAASLLPHLVYRLGIIRPAERGESLSDAAVRETLLAEHLTGDTRGSTSNTRGFVQPVATDAVEHVWFGEEIPLGATVGVEAAYEHRRNRRVAESISISVVHNGEVGSDEQDVLVDTYEETAYLPFEVTMYHDLDTESLAEVLEEPADFFHYVGHVDEPGFRCLDGHLAASSLRTSGPKAFLLNACDSYAQGIELVNKGSAGGIVTFAAVSDQGAGHVGRTMARLLHRGFPLHPAFSIARTRGLAGIHYLVVGDGSADLAQSPHGPPILCDAAKTADPEIFEVSVRAFLPEEAGMGILVIPYLGDETYHLAPGTVTSVSLSGTELRDYVDTFGGPVRIDGNVYWRSAAIPGSSEN